MKKIAILTSSRSDFGLLRRVIELCSYVFDADLLVLGSHASAHQDNAADISRHLNRLTLRQIPIAFGLEDLSHQAQCQAVAEAQSHLARHFAQQHYELLLLLGDRWELFGASIPAFLFNIPIAHISGGEVTEGAIDDSIRHAHTKLASLHFTANELYAANVSRMGEEDWRITVSGECGLDAIHQSDIATPEEIFVQYGIDLAEPIVLVTLHPSTRELQIPVQQQIASICTALERFTDLTIVFTAPGLESGADQIIDAITRFVATGPRRFCVASFGSRNYLSVLKHSKVVLGNSSSGLVEAASFGVPGVNIGKRQEGRLAAPSVLHCGYVESEIAAQLDTALSEQFQTFSRQCSNPYDPYHDGRNSDRIVYALQRALDTIPHERLLKKKLAFPVQENEWNTLLKGFK
ncbi:GDP/UDP-N,N'-diacetylbacillosamine 2-epimerase (hydrolyzing) [Oxalobacteraceae bacterium GrIS 2.11]